MAEEHISGDALIAELNDLLQLDWDAVGAYTIAIAAAESVTYRETLQGFLRDHERHIEELTKLVKARGGVPMEMPHLTGVFKTAVQAAGTPGGDRELILAFKANEGQSRDKYARDAERPHTPQVAEVLRRAAADEQKHYEWAESRLKRLDAGPNTTTGKVEAVFEQVHGRAADAVEAVERKADELLERIRK